MSCLCDKTISDFHTNEKWSKTSMSEELWGEYTKGEKIEKIREKVGTNEVPCGCETVEECEECSCPVCVEECHPEGETADNYGPTMDVDALPEVEE